jgi:uncharacterized integral membrane protein
MKPNLYNVVWTLLFVVILLIVCAIFAADARADDSPPQTASEAVAEAVDSGNAVIVTPKANEPVVVVTTRDKWTPENTAWAFAAIAGTIATVLVPAFIAMWLATRANRNNAVTQAQVTTEAAHSRAQDRRMDEAGMPSTRSNP